MNATFDQRVKLIAEDREHGAGWLARQAVETLAAAVEEGADPLETGRTLASARPAIGAIAGALGRVLAAAQTPEQISAQCRALIERRDRAAHSIAVLLKPDVQGTVMTHSASATVREALLYNRPPRVVCTVSDPQGEGRPFSEDLSAEGLAVELVPDEDAAHAVASVDALVVGADSVFRDGSLVNKTGTSALATAANEAAVPVFVTCETFKLAPFGPPADGLRGWAAGSPLGDEEAFDLTPPDRIDRYVTEEGVITPDDVGALVDRTPFLRQGWELLRTEAAA